MAEPAPGGDPYAEAEHLVRAAQRAAEAAAAAAEPPPGGWDVPRGDGPPPSFPDLSQLAALVESLRGALPPHLARQLTDALRDLLLALRAVLDYSIARLDAPEPEAREVRDIPIE